MASSSGEGAVTHLGRWLSASVLLSVTVIGERLLQILMPISNPEQLFLIVFVVIATLHGLVIGLAATVVGCLYLTWLFADPGTALSLSGSQIQRVAIMWCCALVMVSVIGFLRGRSRQAASLTAQLAERHAEEALKKKDHLLADFVENCAIGIQWLDRDGRIQWANSTDLQMLGYPRDEYIGRHFSSFHVDQAVAADIAERLARNESIDAREAHLRSRDGEIKTVLITTNALIFNGKFIHTRCFIRDITETTRMEDSLRDSQHRLKLAVSAAELGTWHLDLPLGGRVIGNDQWKSHFGLPAGSEMTLDLLYSRIHPDDREIARVALEKAVAERSVYDVEYRTVSDDGRIRWIRSIGRVSCDDQGNPNRFDGVSINKTASKTGELALVEQAEELARSNAELEQFAYVASHDLQEPLRMISTYLQILETQYADRFDDKAHKYMEFVSGGATRMRVLINALLEYSRIGTGSAVLEPLDSAIPLRDALANLAQQFTTTGAKIHFAGMPVVSADRIQLTQLFQNLIANALKFRSERPPALRVTAYPNGQSWVFSVTDNGIGIHHEDRERIFKLFQRLNVDGDYAGSGIGLATCKKIVERHHGRIWVESEPGNGSTFYFTLPKK